MPLTLPRPDLIRSANFIAGQWSATPAARLAVTDPATGATITEVPDRLAYQTGVLFAEVLGRTGDLAAAYEQSHPVERLYVYESGIKKKWQTTKPRRISNACCA